MSVLDIWQKICFYCLKIYKHMITLFKDPFFTGFDKAFESRFTTTPETNISKTETEYVVSISVPGLSKDDLKILAEIDSSCIIVVILKTTGLSAC